MFKEFFIRELKGGLGRPMVWIFMFLVALMVFGAVSSDSIVIGGTTGNVFKNAPHVITRYTLIMSLIGLLFAAAFFNNAALRDHNNNFHEILFSTPLSKAGFFFGRFFGALILATIPLLGVFVGALIGSVVAPAADWLDADRIGPFYLSTFVNNYLLFILPNTLLAGSILFALANRFKSTVISFVGALGIIVLYSISGTLLSDIENETMGAMLDMFGIRGYSVYSRYFTQVDKNTLSPGFDGVLLYNRLIWISIGLIILALGYMSFSFKAKQGRVSKKALKAGKADAKAADKAKVQLPRVSVNYSLQTEWQQFLSFYKLSMLSISKSVIFRILFIFGLVLLISNVWGGFEYYGLQSYPVTYKMSDTIQNSTLLFFYIILVFFSGELVWRDRDRHIHEVIDATAHHSLSSLVAKMLSLISVVCIMYFSFIVYAMLYQLLNGYTKLELDVYLGDFLFNNFAGIVVWSCLAVFIQVLLNHKYLGYFVTILLIFLWDLMLSIFDVSSNMLSIGGAPSLQYSDISGFGPGLASALWHSLYWILIGIILLLVAGLIWNRGVVNGLRQRLSLARKGLKGRYALALYTLVGVWMVTAGFVYYNTQVLNSYQSGDEREELRAEYEKRYKKYQEQPMPKITSVKYNIDLFPADRDVKVRAMLNLKNDHSEPISEVHFILDDDWDTEISIPGANLKEYDEEIGYQIYTFAKPMQPGEQMEISINNNYITEGFQNGQGATFILENGSFLNSGNVLPNIGYQPGGELSDKNTRKKYDLKPKERTPKLRAKCGDHCMHNYLTEGGADWIDIETVISTSGDQLAIAPGSLLKQWSEGDRSYFHYKVDHKSQYFCSFMSARYQVAKRMWNGISMEVYYDEKHEYNVERMLNAIEKSLRYYTEHFGPYYHKQARIIEFPRYSTFAQAFPGTMPYSESFGFITNLEDEENNVVDAVIAHEMAHQYWAHQVIGADMQGGTMLSESFAEYSSLMVMKQESDPLEMKDFLKYDMSRYLRGRSSETKKELPLYKVENQGYIHYGKGAVILYALQDFIGEKRVNQAMRDFVDSFAYREPPYPTSLDFLATLDKQIPDSFKYLMNDWFKEITLYDLRLEEARCKPLEDGRYEVSLDIHANKIKADSVGAESILPPKDWIDVGLFSDSDEEELMIEKRVLISEEKQTVKLIVDEKPARAAVDPRRILIEKVNEDNNRSVEMLEP